MVTISKFSVTRFTIEEVRPFWDSNEVAYPNFIRVDIYLDGEFEEAEGNKDFLHHVETWCSSSFAAHKLILSYIIDSVL